MGDILYGFLSTLGYDHPIHPVLVNVTIGAVVGAFLFDYIGWIFNKTVLYTSARHVMVLGGISFAFTGLAGLLDWQHFYQLAVLPVFVVKFILAGILLLIFIASYLVYARTRENHLARHLLYLAAFLCVAGLGFEGGNIVFG